MFSHHQGKAATGKTYNAVRELLAAGQSLGVVYKNKAFADRTVLKELRDQIGETFENFPRQYDSVWHLQSGQVITIVGEERVRGLQFDAILIDDEDWSMQQLLDLVARAKKIIWAHDLLLV